MCMSKQPMKAMLSISRVYISDIDKNDVLTNAATITRQTTP